MCSKGLLYCLQKLWKIEILRKASSNQNGQAFLAQQEVKLLLFVS